jgi:hypothetical protein
MEIGALLVTFHDLETVHLWDISDDIDRWDSS